MPKRRIMIVDDEPDVRDLIAATLSQSYETLQAHDGLDALEKLERSEPDFVILDIMMPLMNGFETCRSIRRHPRFKDLSVLFLSALNSRQHIKQGYAVGGNLYLTKPIDPLRLLRNVDLFFETHPVCRLPKRFTIEQLEQMQASGPQAVAASLAPLTTPPANALPADQPRLLVVDDDEEHLNLCRLLLQNDYEVTTARDGMEAIQKVTAYQPDMVVLDVMMPKLSGYQLCQSLRQNARYAKTPILFLSAKCSPRERDYALRMGADDLLGKPFEPLELKERLERLKSRLEAPCLPKTLTLQQIQIMERGQKEKLEQRQDRLLRKEELELEKTLGGSEG